jgi:hypothetical protein
MKWCWQFYRWLNDSVWKRKAYYVEADSPPESILGRDLIVAREGGENWAVAFLCPCGCGDRLELVLIPEAKPHWSITVDDRALPTLRPSVWRKTNCKSHFFINQGKVSWC